MATFKYNTRVRGKVLEREINAENKKAAAAALKQKNVKFTKLAAKKGGFGNIQLFQSQQKITEKEVVLFTRQFSTMIDAGLPLVQCLDILARGSDNKSFAHILNDVKSSVEMGSTLSEAMKKHPKIFDTLYSNMVEAGEAGGTLDSILQRLAIYIEKAQALKGKVKSALVYPSAIIGVATLVVAFLMIFVIPAFAGMFEGSGAELPGPTQIVMDISDMFRTKVHYMIGTIVAFVFAFKKIYTTKKGRHEIDRISLQLPVVGILIRKVAVAKFTRTLGALLAGGVPLIEALDICARIAGNKIVENAIFKTITAIKEGETIAAPLARENVFPPMVVQMIDVGESSGALDTMLSKIADFYDEEVDTAVDGLTALLEPMLMVFLGMVVGFIVVAMYLPIFKMGETI